MIAGQVHAQQAAATEVEEVVVTGFRASLANALNVKKNSNLIIESVTAEDMGKFPDQNISESLQRLPGVQIDRENGQGTKVRIRGLDQNVTLLNGDTFLSGLEAFRLGEGNNKQTNSLEGIPSDLLAGVDVIKSPRADVIEGGLGGTVNLKTRNALDLRDTTTMSADVRYSQGSFNGKAKPQVSVVLGHKFSDNFGLLGSFTWDKNNIDTEILSGENRGNWAFLNRNTATGNNQVATGTTNVWSPEYRYTNNRHQERERMAFSLNADLHVSDSLTVRADWFHSDLKIFTGEHSLKWAYANENATYNAQGLSKDSDGVLQSGFITANSSEGDTFAKDAEAKTDNVQFSADWDNGGPLSGKFRVAVSKSDYASTSAQVDTRYTQYGVRNGGAGFAPNSTAPLVATYGYTNGAYPKFTPAANLAAAMVTPSSVFYKSHWAFGDETTIDDTAVTGDFKYKPSFAEEANLVFSFGARYSNREIDSTYGRYLADYSAKGELPASAQGTTDHGVFVDWTPLGYFQDGAIGLKKCDIAFYGCGRFGNSPAVVTPYQTAASNPERGVVDTVHGVAAIFQDYGQMKNPVAWIQGLYPSTKFGFYKDPIESFKIQDKTTSTYAMADLGDADDAYHINAGVRIVHTKLVIDSSNTPVTPLWWGTDSWNGVLKNPNASNTVREYTDVLPSLSGVFEINETDKVRASAARVVSAQNLFDLGQGASYNFTRSSNPGPNLDKFLYTSGNGGNPNLDPFRASQFDIAYERYFGSQGLLSAGFFYKTVDTFIVSNTFSVTVKDQSVAGSSVGPFASVVNGEGGTIKGVELQAQYAFDFGFGFTANYTYSDSESPYSNDYSKSLPIPGVSKSAYNLQGYYETGPFSARLSYAWRDKAFVGNYGFGAGADVHTLGIYNDAYGQLDGQIAFAVTPALKFTLEGSNLTKEDAKTYLQFPNLPFRFVGGDRRLSAGVRFKFGM
ncbi:TonB-dependent receptor [Caulobacter sp. DWR1-3-2b1]|uniref:TonB-dependent receptor n=1 Tax=Caulobacter sp. DWR1-3-2b1 TaxID=2804670 RepID=UPI003CF38949